MDGARRISREYKQIKREEITSDILCITHGYIRWPCCNLIELNMSRRPPLMEMHMHRLSYLARAVRMGVNTLLIDTDVFIFRDPYKRVHKC